MKNYEIKGYNWEMSVDGHKVNLINRECGLISYFTKDDAKVFNYAQGIDVGESYKEIFNF